MVIHTDESRELLTSDAALQQSVAGILPGGGYLTLPISPRSLFVAATRASVVGFLAAFPARELIARHNRAVVRRAAVFVGASDRSQEAFIATNFGAEPHDTMIKGLAARWRGTSA